MGARTRARRARRAWLVPYLVLLLRALRWGVQALPERLAGWLGLGGSWVFDLCMPRTPIRRNLRLMAGRELGWAELRRFERAYFQHLGLTIVEWLRMPLIGERHFEPEGLEELRPLREAGGLIFVTGHAGQWELAAHVGGLLGFALTVTAKMSGREDLDGFSNQQREASGNRFIDSRGTLWTLKKTLDRGGNVGLDVDQQARSNNVFVPFFGVDCACSATPANLQLQTRRPIAVCAVHRIRPWRYRFSVLDVIPYQSSGRGKAARQADAERIIDRINRSFEATLQAAPAQWLWSHRRFRRRPPGREDEAWPFPRSQTRDVRLDLSAFRA